MRPGRGFSTDMGGKKKKRQQLQGGNLPDGEPAAGERLPGTGPGGRSGTVEVEVGPWAWSMPGEWEAAKVNPWSGGGYYQFEDVLGMRAAVRLFDLKGDVPPEKELESFRKALISDLKRARKVLKEGPVSRMSLPRMPDASAIRWEYMAGDEPLAACIATSRPARAGFLAVFPVREWRKGEEATFLESIRRIGSSDHSRFRIPPISILLPGGAVIEEIQTSPWLVSARAGNVYISFSRTPQAGLQLHSRPLADITKALLSAREQWVLQVSGEKFRGHDSVRFERRNGPLTALLGRAMRAVGFKGRMATGRAWHCDRENAIYAVWTICPGGDRGAEVAEKILSGIECCGYVPPRVVRPPGDPPPDTSPLARRWRQLDLTPKRAEAVRVEEASGGGGVLCYPATDPGRRTWLHRLLGVPPIRTGIRTARLDPVGRFVIERLDGRSLWRLLDDLCVEFKTSPREAYLTLLPFMNSLLSRGIIRPGAGG
ncbi:MAG: PqqD family protein [Planctomycetota bacterium]|nr:PqqD family protein [Planctomycetota bacterium]